MGSHEMSFAIGLLDQVDHCKAQQSNQIRGKHEGHVSLDTSPWKTKLATPSEAQIQVMHIRNGCKVNQSSLLESNVIPTATKYVALEIRRVLITKEDMFKVKPSDFRTIH
jgi:hypothetical protein